MLDHTKRAIGATLTKENTLLLATVKARKSGPSVAQRVPSTASAQRRMTTQLRLPAGKRDLQTLMAVIDDWIVPLLVTEFLAEHSAGTVATEANGNQRTTKTRTRKK